MWLMHEEKRVHT